MEWLIAILIIVGVLLIIIPILAYAFDGQSKWWIWLLVALGVLALFIALIIWLVYESAKEVGGVVGKEIVLVRKGATDVGALGEADISGVKKGIGQTEGLSKDVDKDGGKVLETAAPLALLA